MFWDSDQTSSCDKAVRQQAAWKVQSQTWPTLVRRGQFGSCGSSPGTDDSVELCSFMLQLRLIRLGKFLDCTTNRRCRQALKSVPIFGLGCTSFTSGAWRLPNPPSASTQFLRATPTRLRSPLTAAADTASSYRWPALYFVEGDVGPDGVGLSRQQGGLRDGWPRRNQTLNGT